MQEAALGKVGWRRLEELARRRREPGHLRSAVAFEIESGRAARRMVTAMLLGLDDERAAKARNHLNARTRAALSWTWNVIFFASMLSLPVLSGMKATGLVVLFGWFAGVIFLGTIVHYVIAGIVFQRRTGIRLKMGYGGWYVPGRRRRRR